MGAIHFVVFRGKQWAKAALSGTQTMVFRPLCDILNCTQQHSMTVRQVAGHIAGIRHYAGMEFMSNEYYPDVRSSLKIFMNDDLLFAPGEKYSYSSYGWNLISAVLEEASGMPFLEYMQQNVFDKAEMRNMHPDFKDTFQEQKVVFYIKSDDKNVIGPEVDNSYKWAGGGFIGTATDLLRFNRNVFNGTLISKSTLTELSTPQTLNNGKTTNYGMGWRATEDKKGRKWIGHGGGSVGGTTMYIAYPDHGITVVTLVNLSRASMDQLAWRVAEQFLTVLEE